jgi:TonB family protein
MIRQLFTSAGGVPEGRRTTDAAPFSVVLHAAAIGALLFFSSQKVASTDIRPPIPVYQPTAAPAAATPVAVVSLAPKPPKVGGAPKAPVAAPARAMSTPKPFVQPPEIPNTPPPDDHNDDPPAMGAPTNGAGPGCTGCAPGVGDPHGPGGDPSAVMPVSSTGVEAPRKVHDVLPKYPELARNIHLEGFVHVECVIGSDGKVRDARVASHSSPLFDADALAAVLQWTYTPPKYNGHPVSVLMTVSVHFHLRR